MFWILTLVRLKLIIINVEISMISMDFCAVLPSLNILEQSANFVMLSVLRFLAVFWLVLEPGLSSKLVTLMIWLKDHTLPLPPWWLWLEFSLPSSHSLVAVEHGRKTAASWSCSSSAYLWFSSLKSLSQFWDISIVIRWMMPLTKGWKT